MKQVTMNDEILKAEIIEVFKGINLSLNTLNLHIHDDLNDLPVWIYDEKKEVFTNYRDKVLYVLKKFSPTASETAKETYSCPGVVAATEQTLELIDAVNTAKDRFKELLSNCKKVLAMNAAPFIRQTLKEAGFGSLKLKTVYRHIKYIAAHPRRISWQKGQHNVNKIVTVKELEKRLSKVEKGENFAIQHHKLALLSNASLVCHWEIKPLWCANYFIKKENGQKEQRGLIRTGLPIFYLHDNKLPLPVVCFSTKSNRQVKARADKQLENTPFLKSLRAYRKTSTNQVLQT
jgi:hypothetical protein